ncbi:uncharacterized protein [Fopius arisanus]|uniref:Uncharacterized protein n=1 Tax=Fopius arisanus TaxID=64838 RepID=A0A9R1TJ68_9HYME|nr:PREDICTED: uncharacterized protein LOC105270761 [Fopius arisanus]
MIKLLRFITLQISKNGVNNPRCERIPSVLRTSYRHGSFTKLPGKVISPKSETALRKKDKLAPTFELIYRSNLTSYVIWLYPLSITSYILVGFAYYYFKIHLQDVSFPIKSVAAPVGYNKRHEVDVTFIFYLAMNTFTLYILRRIPMRIWLDNFKKEYRMILIGNNQSLKRQIAFQPGEVTRNYIFPSNSFQEMMHRYRKKLYFISSVDFRSPVDYNQMTGYSPNLTD